MKPQLQEFNQELLKRVTHFLWRQWGQLGMASSSVEPRDGWLIDPEALLLLSATYARHDPRLFDEIMDWLSINSGFVNVSRLKSALHKYNFSGRNILSALSARITRENKRINWKLPTANLNAGPEPLFLDTTGKPLPDFGQNDEIFLDAGFKRGKVEFSLYA